jgi:HAD superfamily hydrolase (TIGR01509 family)
LSKIVLFDYFGVVASDAYWYCIKGVEALNGRAAEIEELSAKVNDGRVSWKEYCAEVAQDLGLSVEQVLERYEQHNVNEGVVRLINELRATHTVSLASNAASEHMQPIMKRTGLEKLFDETFFSSDIGASKPDPRFFEYIMHFYEKSADDFVFIDDSAQNVDVASGMGIKSILFIDQDSLRDELLQLL